MSDSGTGGIFGGLLNPDANALYTGLLSDPATQRALANRQLMAMAGAFGEAAMPKPYRVPIGAALGSAAAAAGNVMDATMKSRLEAMQALQAQYNAQNLQSQLNIRNQLFDPNHPLGKALTAYMAGQSGEPAVPPVATPSETGEPTISGTPAAGDANIANNNFAGMRQPGVPAAGGPKTNPAGWQTFGTPEAGLAGIGIQLDRYASGATTGKPINTLAGIISTWAPPGENPTAQLIQRAAKVTGFDPNQPLDLSDPTTKAKVAEALIRNEHGGALPAAVTPERMQKVFNAKNYTFATPTVAATGTGPEVTSASGPVASPTPLIPAPAETPAQAATRLFPMPSVVGRPTGEPAPPVAFPAPPRIAGPPALSGPSSGGPPALPAAAGDDVMPPATAPGRMIAGGQLGGGLVPPPPAPAPAPYSSAAQVGLVPPPPAAPTLPPVAARPAAAPGPGPAMPTVAQPMSPKELQQANALAMALDAAGLPTMAAQIKNDPRYLAGVEQAKAAAGLPFVGPKAEAEARAKMPYTITRVPPGGGVSVGGAPPAFYAPSSITAFNPATQRVEHATQTIGPNGAPVIQYSGVPAQPSPQEKATGETRGRIGAEQEPLPPKAPAPGTPGGELLQGTPLAPKLMSTQPVYNEPGYSAAELEKYRPGWANVNKDLLTATGTADLAEHRLMDIANAFKMFQTGAYTTEKGAFNALMTSIFGERAPQLSGAPPADIELALHQNYQSTLAMLAAVNKRFTNNEFRVTSEVRESPNVQPEANLQMLSEDIGQLRQLKGLAQDWVTARIAGKQDPEIYQTKWLGQNKLAPIVQAVKEELQTGPGGPIKGTGPQMLAPGQIGYGPKGVQIENRNGVLIDRMTGKPYQP